jgi:hypothetical protein
MVASRMGKKRNSRGEGNKDGLRVVRNQKKRSIK